MTATRQRPKVVVVGGPDVDLRLELMDRLRDDFELSAIGSNAALDTRFAEAGFRYNTYSLDRRINPVTDLRGLRQMVRMFKRVRPHIVHTYATKPGVWGRLAARVAGVPVIIGTLPGLGTLYASNDIVSRTIRLAYQPLQKLACRVSDLTIFQNQNDANQFIAAAVVPEDKSTIIPGSGVATDRFARARVPESKKKELRSELGIDADDLVVTMISRITRSKGALEFLEAARATRSHHPEVRFILIGPEDRGVDRLNSAELAELKRVVTCLGVRRDIVELLAVTDIFAFPSVYREGIPRVLLEAASMELPLVTTDLPGCNDVVENGANGFLVPAYDPVALTKAIVRLAEQPELRRRFGKVSRERVVEDFDLSLVADRTRSVYWQLLNLKGLLGEGRVLLKAS
jgi:glycosyltransferase involved in cell wall biosynthesis